MTEFRKCRGILLTQNIREFEKGLLMMTDRLFVIDKAARYGADPVEGITFIKERRRHKWQFYSKLIKENGISVVYVQGFRDLLFWGMLRFIKRLACKIIVASHSPYTWAKLCSAVPSLVLARLFANAMVFISLREYCRYERFCNFIGLKAFYVPNSIDETRFPAEKVGFLKDKQLSLVSTGTVEPRKNQKFLVWLVKELLNRGVDCRVCLIGDYQIGANLDQKYYDSICKEIDASKLEGRFTFLGRVPYDEVPNKLRDFDVFVSSSKSEMYPFSIIEGMLVGLPVVAFDANGICDEIKDGYNGYLIPLHLSDSESVRRWSDCMQHLMDGDNLRLFGKRSREIALACNSSRALSLRLSNVLSSIGCRR